MNALNAFFHPGKTAKHYLAHPSAGLVILLAFLPILALNGLKLATGLRLPETAAVDAGKGLFLWLASAVVLYVLLYLLKGKPVQGKFLGVLNALALTRMFSAAIIACMFLFGFVLAPAAFGAYRKVQDSTAPSLESLVQAVGDLPVHTDPVSVGLSFFLLLFMAVLVLLSFYVWYATIAGAGPGGTLKNLVILAAGLLVSALISGFF